MEKKGIIIILVLAIIIVLGVFIWSFLRIDLSPDVGRGEIEECKTLKYNGEGKIDIVFLSDGGTAKKYSDYLLNIDPFKENTEDFNFYYVDDYEPECEFYKDIALLCYNKEVVKKAGSCPNDYVVVVREEKSNIRSSSYMNVMSLNSKHKLNVFPHEFGHAFASFAEEYVPGNIPKNAKNCVAECADFQGEEEGCFEGCSKTNRIRSVNNGVMRSLSSDDFGDFNEKILQERIDESLGKQGGSITGRVGEVFTECVDQEYYLLTLEKTSEGIVEKKKNLEVGCLPALSTGSYSYSFLGAEGGGNFDPENLFTVVEDDSGETGGETYSYLGEFLLPVPIVDGAEVLRIDDGAGIVLEVNLLDVDARACRI
ncbi:hypothetical protein CMI45_00770 [Candidatus Pacearchaeota archaeon]|nr:hypothetical protein [Candidatus Pacearchaeota archaeon]|tara:strand:- start:1523 stop:2629 length:1107 start_codon:yes stop_codon:yes gene_type:complete